jgi:hypothetical protein
VLTFSQSAYNSLFTKIRNVIAMFASKWNSKAFDYCSCEGFAQTLGKRGQFVSSAIQKCSQR